MESATILLAIITLVSWGIGSFIDKIAATRIGLRSLLWAEFGFLPLIIGFIVWFIKTNEFIAADKLGVGLAVLAGFVGSVGAITYFLLLTREEATRAIPLTALYPALAAILAFLFLKEGITAIKLVGIF